MSRPGLGIELITRQPGDDEVKRRVRICFATVYGTTSVEQAMRELDLSKQRFHELRDEIIAGAIAGGTPKPGGRPAKPQPPPVPDDVRVQLARQAKDLEILQEGLRVREELEAVLGRRLKTSRTLEQMLANANVQPADETGKAGKKG